MDLSDTNGCVILGTVVNPNERAGSAITPVPLAIGVHTYGPFYAPCDALKLSFNVRVKYLAGSPTVAVQVRCGNRFPEAGQTLTSRGLTGPTALAAMSADGSAHVVVDADANVYDLVLTVTGAAVEAVVIGAAR